MKFNQVCLGIGLVVGAGCGLSDARAADSARYGAASAPEPRPDANPSARRLELQEQFTNGVGMLMIKVPRGFWAASCEVTQKQFQEVMGYNPSHFQGAQHPVDGVSWFEAREFCQRLTRQERADERLPQTHIYTLPSEREWEYLVADATLDQAVTSDEHARNSPAPVATLPPNHFGLHDIRGNVWEWCRDWHDTNYNYRVLRGASWKNWIDVNLRKEFRFYSRGPEDDRNMFGFRCVIVPETRPQPTWSTPAMNSAPKPRADSVSD